MLSHKKKQIAKRGWVIAVKKAQRTLCWDDDTYRIILKEHGGVSSSTELNNVGFKAVMAHAKKCGYKVDYYKKSKKKYDNLKTRRGDFASPAQLRMLEAMWRGASREKTDEALNNFLKKRFGIQNFMWVRADQVTKIKAALERMGAENATS